MGHLDDMKTSDELGERIEFGAPWGTPLKVISVVATVVVCAVGGGAVWHTPTPQSVRWLMALLPALVLVPCGLLTVRGYALEGNSLLIHRLCWSTRLGLRGVESVAFDAQAMRGSIRLCGNGGLFAFIGWYRNRTLGVYRAFVTDFKRLVVLRFARRVVVVSPDEPERFVAELQRRLDAGKLGVTHES